MKKIITSLFVFIALATCGIANAQHTGSQGPVMFSFDCPNSPQYGKITVCFDTTQLAWYAWSTSSNSFQPINSGSSVPTPVSSSAFLQDNGVGNYVESILSQDLSCAVGGVCTVLGLNTVPFSGSLIANTAGQVYITNASNQFVPGAIPADPNNAIGQIPAVSATGTPNTYSSVTPGVQGTIVTSNGATSLPTYQKSTVPIPLDFYFTGSFATSAQRIAVCPATLNVAPGFAGLYPYTQSQATLGTTDSGTDTFTLTDVTTSTTVGTASITTGGAVSFATTNCSSSFHGTQGSTAWARIASAGTTAPVVIPSGASSGDGAILGCYYAGNGGFTAPTGVTGWTAVTNGEADGGTSSIKLYEKILGIGDPGSTVNCNNSGSAAAMSAAVFTMQGVPNGEIVDVAAAIRGGSSTTIGAPSVTPNHNGELIIQGAMTGANFTVSSWSPVNTNVASTVAGVGAQYLVQGVAGATGTATATWGSASLAGAFQIALLNSATKCPLCTAGDQMKLQVGTVSGSPADGNIVFNGGLN